jgi:hypothetical protein
MGLPWSSWSRGIYPHGVLCGLLMVAFAYWARGYDLPVPLIAIFLFMPYSVLSGFLAARRNGVEAGMATGAATAVTGDVIVFGSAAIYSAATPSQPWTTALLWVAVGLLMAFFMALVGVFCGRLGAALARLGRSTPS